MTFHSPKHRSCSNGISSSEVYALVKKCVVLFCFLCSMVGNAQTAKTNLSFIPEINGQPLKQGVKYYIQKNSDSVSIDLFMFYISNVEFVNNGKVVVRQPESFYLLDMFDAQSCQVLVSMQENTQFDHVRFNLGIDSATNVSGAMGGVLDPTKGMYWAWQSGYINMKLEGTSNKCQERNHRFQYHLGGYAAPFSALQKVEIAVQPGNEVSIVVDVQHFLGQLNLGTLSHVMSPCAKAVELSAQAIKMFSAKQ